MIAMLVTACQHPVDPVQKPGTVGTPPRDSTTTKPGSTTSTPPGSATSTPSDGTVSVFRTLRITYAPTDFQEIQYDADGKPVRYASRMVYILGGNSIIQQRAYQFLYQANGAVNQLTIDGGGYLRYSYENNRISHVDEYTAKHQLVVIRMYQYSATNQLMQVDENFVRDKRETRKTYQYDSRGNLTLHSEFVKSPANGTYGLDAVTAFEEYDGGKHVENLLAEFPFLPGVTFRVNNYGRKIVRYKDGSEISRETYTYRYDKNGYPTQRVSHNAGGTLTATYTWTGSL